tara:strand:+ start:417 stop:608 length:192 start_codon:yes stop_codon:yes gene_type:complete
METLVAPALHNQTGTLVAVVVQVVLVEVLLNRHPSVELLVMDNNFQHFLFLLICQHQIHIVQE